MEKNLPFEINLYGETTKGFCLKIMLVSVKIVIMNSHKETKMITFGKFTQQISWYFGYYFVIEHPKLCDLVQLIMSNYSVG
jgi:hypothetical protein